VTEIVRKDSKTPVCPGDVLTVVLSGFWAGAPALTILVCCIKDGYVWGHECDAGAAPFGPLLAFLPENVGCEMSGPNRPRDVSGAAVAH
jgi:hypothetical protein